MVLGDSMPLQNIKIWILKVLYPDGYNFQNKYQSCVLGQNILRDENIKLRGELIPDWFKGEYNKYPTAKIVYRGRPVYNHPNIIPEFDVRTFIEPYNSVFQDILKENNLMVDNFEGEERIKYDLAVLRIARFLASRIKYEYDKTNFGHNEFWAQPTETWALKADDCDGSTNLFISFMINAGVPYYLLRNCCGTVRSGQGHSTLYYFASDNQWHHIETTKAGFIERNALEFPLRNDITDRTNISQVWFSFDAKNTYNKFVTDFALTVYEKNQSRFKIWR